MKVPSCVLWGLTKRNSPFIRKYKNNRAQFSQDPLNLTGLHNASAEGLSNEHSVGLSVSKVASKKGKGQKRVFVLTQNHKQIHKRRLSKKGGDSQAGPSHSKYRLGREVNAASKSISKISGISEKARKLALKRLGRLHAASRPMAAPKK